MTPEEWHKVKEVLQTAVELDPQARETFLDSACAGQESMRSEVESLLKSHEQDDAFLEHLAGVEAADLIASTPGVWIGRRLGPYELLEEIGEGGMGAVYRAVRADGMYDKQVAIKLIRSGLSTGFFFSRFRNERQILAGLEHPNIARLLDGGVTEEGLPYVVLEFVAGRPIDEYCARHDLPIAERLKLFRTVCSAVQYAHQNLVVHRDLKPGNILVTEEGVPKLLDFGIAKILDPAEEGTEGDRTLTAMRVMTPDFASPEQVRGDTITTASDVYSLGVILYLLLSGRRPYRVSSSAPHEIIKAISDTDPEKPSTAATRLEKRQNSVRADSRVKQTNPIEADPKREKLRRALSGDLDNIVLKALRKEPGRRYATVEQFSEDVRRHLEHLPVIARRDTPAYRTSKFVMRHKPSAAAGLVVALTLIAALVITVREARIAQRRFNDVRSLANSLIFDVHDSIQDLPGSTPARKVIVDRALQYLNALAQESSGDLGLQRELATAYSRVGLVQGHYRQNNLGDVKGSLDSYKRALEIRKQVDAKSRDWNDRLALATAYRVVAELQGPNGDEPEARISIDRAIAIAEALSKAHPNNPTVLYELGFDYESSNLIGYRDDPNDTRRREDCHKALATDEALLKIQPDDLRTLNGYAVDLSRMGSSLEGTDPKAAMSYFHKDYEIELRLTQRSSEVRYQRGLAAAYADIASVYDDLGDYPRAAENYTKSLAIHQQISQADPQNTYLRQSMAISYANTAMALAKVGNTRLGLEDWNKANEIMRKLASSAPENMSLRHSFAAVVTIGGAILMHAHQPQAAYAEFHEAHRIYQSLRDASFGFAFHAACTAECIEKMAEASALAGNRQAAADYFQSALAFAEPLISASDADANALYIAADAYSGLGDLSLKRALQPRQTATLRKASWTEARSWYVKSLATWHRIEHPNHTVMNGFDAGDPTQVAKKLHLCEAALARSSTPYQ
jgi:serine/threonine protein kinase